MALTCDTAFSDNTYGETICAAQQFPNNNQLAPTEILDHTFLFVVLDALQRLGGDLPNIEDAEMCDVQQAAYLANCSVADRAFPTERLDPAKLKALILWQLNEALCS